MELRPGHEIEFGDSKYIYIKGVYIKKPDEIPLVIYVPSHWETIQTVPPEVSSYFTKNPEVAEYAYEDGYVYKRPYHERDPKGHAWEMQVIQEMAEETGLQVIKHFSDDDYDRTRNFAPQLRKLIVGNESLLEFFKTLEQRVGQQVPTSEVLPSWGWNPIFRSYKIPNSDDFWINFMENNQGSENTRTTEIQLFGARFQGGEYLGPLLCYLLQIGSVEYEDRS